MLPYILHFMKISQNQTQMEEKSYTNKKNGSSTGSPISNENSTNDSESNIMTGKKSSIGIKKNLEKLDIDEDIDYLEYFVYNSYWTLRKCSSNLLDKISCLYSLTTFFILKPFLEVDLQSSDWIKK